MNARVMVPAISQRDDYTLLISADPSLAVDLALQFQTSPQQTPAARGLVTVVRLAQARSYFRMSTPAVIVLDESACATGSFASKGDSPLAWAVKEMAEAAPVILICGAMRPGEMESLASLVASGRLDVVTRGRNSPALIASLLDRRLAEVLQSPWTTGGDPLNLTPDFGEILRHELNNPLTGILGNAELLLARQDQFSSAAVRRLETIASLAVRMREAVRRLSDALHSESEHERARM